LGTQVAQGPLELKRDGSNRANRVSTVCSSRVLITLALALGASTSGGANSIDPAVPTEIRRTDMCEGDFKAASDRLRIARAHFDDALPRTVTTPIVWNTFRGERELFGYSPSFTPNRISFATNGRPIIRDRELNLQVLTDMGSWDKFPLLHVAAQSLQQQGVISSANPWLPKLEKNKLFDSGPHSDERVVFDHNCRAYTLINSNYSTLGRSFLLYSNDGGHSWAAYPIPKTDDPLYTVSIEAPVNGSVLWESPALIVAESYDPALPDGSYPRNAHKAWLLFPVLTPSGRLTLAGPFSISDHTLCCGSHSGFEAQAVSYRGHIHIAYPGDSTASDPTTHERGTPQFLRTFSRHLQRFINAPVFVGVGLLGPENQVPSDTHDEPDSHSQTAVAIDHAGFVHVVIGGHGSHLVYRKSLRPDNTDQWSKPEVFSLHPKAGDRTDFVDEYTYPSLILDRDGQPNVLARWSGDSYTFRLIYTLRSNRTNSWAPQQVLLDPGRAYYGVWYHKMTSDPWGRLFVSYSYYPDNLFSDEAETLATEHRLTLHVAPSNPPCVPTRLNASKPNYCQYLGYADIGGAIIMRRPGQSQFVLASTPEFFEF
jgi:hypothetical protein